jgi:hypothetical protein
MCSILPLMSYSQTTEMVETSDPIEFLAGQARRVKSNRHFCTVPGDGPVSNTETYENLVLGSGLAGKFITWTMAEAGHRTAMVELSHSKRAS